MDKFRNFLDEIVKIVAYFVLVIVVYFYGIGTEIVRCVKYIGYKIRMQYILFRNPELNELQKLSGIKNESNR